MLEAAMIMRADAMICPPYTWTEVTMLPAQQMVTKKNTSASTGRKDND